MSEERVLAERAARAIRGSNHRLLIIGLVLSTVGILLMVWPDLRAAIGGGEEPVGLAGSIAFGLVGAVIAAIGVSLLRAAFGRFDAEGRTQTWFVVVTAVPFLGRLVRWIVLRSERNLIDPGRS